MNNPLPDDVAKKLSEAYDMMLLRTRETMDKAEKNVGEALEMAMQKASDLGELTREEADLLGIYVMRDLEDAAKFVDKSGQELRDWLRFDVNVVENTLLDIFSNMVDHTREALDQLQERANAIGEWHTGEVTGIGTLQCKSCGEEMHFHKTSHIPPCPKCHGTKFRRIAG
jgi:predicted Zn-ribbon and HTH transcriptional regulator